MLGEFGRNEAGLHLEVNAELCKNIAGPSRSQVLVKCLRAANDWEHTYRSREDVTELRRRAALDGAQQARGRLVTA